MQVVFGIMCEFPVLAYISLMPWCDRRGRRQEYQRLSRRMDARKPGVISPRCSDERDPDPPRPRHG